MTTQHRYFVQASGSPFWSELTGKLAGDYELRFAFVDDRVCADFLPLVGPNELLRGNDLKYALFDRTRCAPIPTEIRFSEQFMRRELEAYYAFDRSEIGGRVSYQDRRVIISSMADFYWSLFERHEPHFGLATESPHTYPTFLLHGIAEALDIPIVQFQQSSILPVVTPVVGRFHDRLPVEDLLNEWQNKKRIDNLGPLRTKLGEGLNLGALQHLSAEETRFQSRNKNLYSGARGLWRKFYLAYGARSDERLQAKSFFSRGNDPFRSGPVLHRTSVMKSRPTWLTTFNLFRQHLNSYKELESALRVQSVQSIPKDFATFFLQFEPEKTSLPDGGNFCDQLGAVRAVAKLLENHLPLLVKEHPSQLAYISRGFTVRTPRFYEEIARIPNVSLCAPEVSRQELMRGNRLSFTLNGTVGLESVAMGIPAIALGMPWYAPLSGLRVVRSEGELEEAIRLFLSQKVPLVSDVEEQLWSNILHNSIALVLNPSARSEFPDAFDDVESLCAVIGGVVESASRMET